MSGMVRRRAAQQLHRLLHCSCSSGVASSTAALASSGAAAATLISVSSRSSSLLSSILAWRGYRTVAAIGHSIIDFAGSAAASPLHMLRAPSPQAFGSVSALHTMQAVANSSSSGNDSSGSGKGSSSSVEASSGSPQQRRKHGRPKSAWPAVDAEQLLHSLGLSTAASADTLLRRMRQLPGMQQQGVVQHAAAVMQHLCSPAVGLDTQQVGQLLERCPELFSRPGEHATLLFGQLMATGLTAAEAAGCYKSFPPAAYSCCFDAGKAELAAILAHSVDREGSGCNAAVPAAERTVAALLRRIPSAIRLVVGSEGKLRQCSLDLQQAGLSPADVATLAWRQPDFFTVASVARLQRAAILLEKHLSLPPAHSLDFFIRHMPLWLTSSAETLEERIVGLAEGFSMVTAVAMVTTCPAVLNSAPEVWRRNLHCMAACGVGDPAAMLARHPSLLHVDHAAAGFVERRLTLQRYFNLTAVQLYEEQAWCLVHLAAPKLAQRLQFIEHRGQLHRLVAKATGGVRVAGAERLLGLASVIIAKQPAFLAAVGATTEQWEAFAAAHPPRECAIYRWAQGEAQQEVCRLRAELPAELQEWEPKPSRFRRISQ